MSDQGTSKQGDGQFCIVSNSNAAEVPGPAAVSIQAVNKDGVKFNISHHEGEGLSRIHADKCLQIDVGDDCNNENVAFNVISPKGDIALTACNADIRIKGKNVTIDAIETLTIGGRTIKIGKDAAESDKTESISITGNSVDTDADGGNLAELLGTGPLMSIFAGTALAGAAAIAAGIGKAAGGAAGAAGGAAGQAGLGENGADLTGIVSIPTGVIVMWSGTTIPSGWALCDGTNSTPDLRNRFIVGANDASKTGITTQTGPGFNVTTGVIDDTYEPGDIGGETSHQLTVAELAAHTHRVGSRDSLTEYGTSSAIEFTANYPSPVGQYVTSDTTGGDDYHENRPPYYALAFIMKT